MMYMRHHVSRSSDEWLHRHDAMVWRQIYPGHGNHVRAARQFPALLLGSAGLADEAEWVTSELVSNAIKFTRSGAHGGWFGLEVGLWRRSAWIAICDQGGASVPTLVSPAPADELIEGGRGLCTVAKLASRLEITGAPRVGHTVYAVFDPAAVSGRQDS
jgi:anti-sigma regulatory factor (Ser/Thr protein kinase)